jgi:wyosine [tRNA(Phe)-imidazoG37] synthetase (radical SAM superfamily)
MTNTRQMFFPIADILKELEETFAKYIQFDVVTLVGEGEPTLYLGMGKIIQGIKERIDKPVAVITNGALLYDETMRQEMALADIVLPSFDAYDEESFRRINRPHRDLHFQQVKDGLIQFSKEYDGELWLELMLMKGINDDHESLSRYKEMLSEIHYDKLYLNTPVRPPAESDVEVVTMETMKEAAMFLDGISIALLVSTGFHSEIEDDFEAVMSIIRRHPMNQFEIKGFLESRNPAQLDDIMSRLKADARVEVVPYKGYETYRLRPGS